MLTFTDIRGGNCASAVPRGTWYAMHSLCCRMRSPCSPASAAGETYSGVGALSLLGRLPRKWQSPANGRTMSPEFVDNITRWLVARQTLTLQDEGEDLTMDDDDYDADPLPAPVHTPDFYRPTFHVIGAFPVSLAQTNQHLSELSQYERQWVGVNGRCNKVADTCYSFWVGGTLGVSRWHATSVEIALCYLELNRVIRYSTKSIFKTSTAFADIYWRRLSILSVALAKCQVIFQVSYAWLA